MNPTPDLENLRKLLALDRKQNGWLCQSDERIKDGEVMSDLDSLVSGTCHLSAKVDFWNSAVVWALLLTVAAATAVFLAQKIALDRSKQLSSLQQEIANIKESNMKQRAGNLEHANLQLSIDLEKEKGKVARLDKDANDARSVQQTVEIELAEQTERTALAERTLSEVQEGKKADVIARARDFSDQSLNASAY